METIRLAKTDKEIHSSYPVMKQLRPDLSEGEFVSRVRRQMEEGYRLAVLVDGDTVAAAAGFRLGQNLAWGKHLYVDDLVTDASRRSRSYGRQLMDWLVLTARESGCRELHLDSGVQRFDAHRFYLKYRMDITSHHFRLDLND